MGFVSIILGLGVAMIVLSFLSKAFNASSREPEISDYVKLEDLKMDTGNSRTVFGKSETEDEKEQEQQDKNGGLIRATTQAVEPKVDSNLKDISKKEYYGFDNTINCINCGYSLYSPKLQIPKGVTTEKHLAQFLCPDCGCQTLKERD